MIRRHSPIRTLVLLATVSWLSGCASTREQLERLPELPEDVTHVRKQRKAEIVHSFEQERNRAQLLAAESRWQQGDHRGARQRVEDLLHRDPENAAAHQLLQQIDHTSGAAPPPGAIENPFNAGPAAPIPAYQPSTPGRVEAASYQLQGSYGVAGKITEINNQAIQLLRASQPDAAVALLDQALSGREGSADLYRTLGLAHYRRGDYDSSQLALQQALSLDNSSPLSYFLMGFTLTKLGDSEGAEWHFRQAAARNPKYAVMR